VFPASDLSSNRILNQARPSEINLEGFQKHCPERDGKLQFDFICPKFCTLFTYEL
jgi:hypothetical protein